MTNDLGRSGAGALDLELERFLREFRAKGHRPPSEFTLRGYGGCVARYLRWLNGRQPSPELQEAYLREYMRNHANNTVLQEYHAISAYHRWKGVPTAQVYIAPGPPRTDFPSVEDVERLIAACNNDYERAVVLLLYQTGIRAGEFLELKWPDVDLEGGFVRVRRKGGAVQDVPMGPRAVEALKRIPRGNGRGYVFPNLDYTRLRRLLERASKRAGVKITPHGLRHACASHLRKVGMPLDRIQAQLGHVNPATTIKYYAHITPHELKEEVDKAWARVGR